MPQGAAMSISPISKAPAGQRDGESVARELQRRLAFEQRITAASASLMRSNPEALDGVVEEVLGSIGTFFAVDRAYVFAFDAASGHQSNTHEWVASGISREAHNLQEIPLDTFPWLMQELSTDRAVACPDIRELPIEAASERAEFEREGICSIAIVPVWNGAQLAGFVGFDAVRQRVEWGDDYLTGLRLLAQMLGSALRSRDMALQLQRLALHDPLTGLPNRKHLQERIEAALATPGACLVVAMLDLDDFKRINDRHGHAVGDAVLCEVARRLSAAAPPGGMVARMGGDEFVFLGRLEGDQRPDAVAGAFLEAFEREIEAEGLGFRLGLSLGMVTAEAGRRDPGQLLRQADAAMYRAKAAGKGGWSCEPATGA